MPPYQLPVTVAADLRPYQREGISWLAFLRRSGLHGVLADDMGAAWTLRPDLMAPRRSIGWQLRRRTSVTEAQN